MNEITTCEICGSKQLRRVLDLGAHPMCDDLVNIGDARVCKEYPIDILFCDTCLTAHQRFQIDKHELFPSTYHYRSRHTADVLNGMQALVAACLETLGSVENKMVLDIGCNDGSLLSFFAQKGAKTFGMEPTDACLDAQANGHHVTQDYFSEQSAHEFVLKHGKADIITFTNVFAHIENLKDVITALGVVRKPETLIVIENHYLGSILETNQFDTFYHEHPRTYSLKSFEYIGASLGMKIARAEFPKRYGGNIRVFFSEIARDNQVSDMPREVDFGDRLEELSTRVTRWRDKKSASLARAVADHGALVGKAFPGRAAIPVKILNLDADKLACVHEKPTSAKVGHYIPSSRIPILSDDAFDISSRRPLLNLAWHISDEIKGYMRKRGFEGEIIDIISQDDFR